MILFVVNVKEAISPLVLYEGEKNPASLTCFLFCFALIQAVQVELKLQLGIKRLFLSMAFPFLPPD